MNPNQESKPKFTRQAAVKEIIDLFACKAAHVTHGGDLISKRLWENHFKDDNGWKFLETILDQFLEENR